MAEALTFNVIFKLKTKEGAWVSDLGLQEGGRLSHGDGKAMFNK